MPTIALVDDDRNILTSVSIALEGGDTGSDLYGRAAALDGLQPTRPTSPSSISRCRAWTAWSFCGVCGRNPTFR